MMGAQLLAMQWEVQSILMFLCVPALIAAIATVFKMTRRAVLQPADKPV
jgi:AAHS family 4-hydroxybenzoate transporter-like MFS transporter